MALPTKGSAAAAVAAPESAGESSSHLGAFALVAERDLLRARCAAMKAAEQLRLLDASSSPLQIAECADRLVAAAGAVWMHAHRLAEARSNH